MHYILQILIKEKTSEKSIVFFYVKKEGNFILLSNTYNIVYIRGDKMANDLLYMSKELLKCLELNILNEDEENYILSVIHKIIIILMIELNKIKLLN